MKRLRIEHATGYSYEGEVVASYNEARMLPSSSDTQFVLSSQLKLVRKRKRRYLKVRAWTSWRRSWT